MSINVEEEWFSVDLESRMNRKIDNLQNLVAQQSQQIQLLLEEIKKVNDELCLIKTIQHDSIHKQTEKIEILSDELKIMKGDLHSTKHQSASQNDRTHQLLEELKVIKQRELNIALREKIPVSFFPIPHSIFTKELPLNKKIQKL